MAATRPTLTPTAEIAVSEVPDAYDFGFGCEGSCGLCFRRLPSLFMTDNVEAWCIALSIAPGERDRSGFDMGTWAGGSRVSAAAMETETGGTIADKDVDRMVCFFSSGDREDMCGGR